MESIKYINIDKILESKKNMLIMRSGEELLFFSYNQLIARYKKEFLGLTDKWNYSQTTLKQLKYFINNYIEEDYYTTKKEFEKKIKKNGFIHLLTYNMSYGI